MVRVERSPPRRRAHGALLLEWTIGSGAGLWLTAAALALFLQQVGVLREVAQRQRVQRDLDAIDTVLQREWRRAGWRLERGPDPLRDGLAIEAGTGSPRVAWARDDTTATVEGHAYSLRLQQDTLQLKTPGTGGFQALHDPRHTPVVRWTVGVEVTAACREVVRWTLTTATPDAAPRTGLVRRRNGAARDCVGLP